MPDDDWTKSAFYSIDPFPKVLPSLLNSADIIRYANKGCLVHPFSRDKKLLNPATYTIRLLGTLYSWEQKGDGRCLCPSPIVEGEPVRIKANSITYLETKEVFRLPQYIAARFNLHIRYVHMGILLGTGPMVDPGFVGPLLIPLHNLTANDYNVEGGDRLLWVEFTKLTPHEYWSRSPEKFGNPPPQDLVVFRSEKRNLKAKKYFGKAEVWNRGVISAFKGALAELGSRTAASEKAAVTARKTVQRLTAAGSVGLVIGALGLGAGIGTLVFSAYQLFQSNSDMVSRIHDRIDQIERETAILRGERHGSSMQIVGETGTADRRSIQDLDGDSEGASDDDSVVEDRDD